MLNSIVSQTHSPTQDPLREWAVQDLVIGSAIRPEIASLNTRITWGEEALEILASTKFAQLQKSTNYVGAAARRLLDRLEPVAERGGWLALPWNTDAAAYFKPVEAVVFGGFGAEGSKPIKYLNEEGAHCGPLLPRVDKKFCDDIARKYGVRFRPETFWTEVKNYPYIPIIITEGWKKALALISQGEPAIALRGITMWHPEGELQEITASFNRKKVQRLPVGGLIPLIEEYCQPDRPMPIVFDQDNPEKIKTLKDVRKQAIALGEELAARGAKPLYPTWSHTQGKGVDDVFASLTEAERGVWFASALKDAKSLKAYRTGSRAEIAREIIKASLRSAYGDRTIQSEGNYIPEIDFKPGITILDAGMGSGKSYQVAREVRQEAAKGGFTMLLAPTNALGIQQAETCGVPHVHDYRLGGDSDPQMERILWADAITRGGAEMCGEALHRFPSDITPTIVSIDEGNQVFGGLTQGDTLGERQSEILLKLAGILRDTYRRGGKIIVAEAGIPDHTIALLMAITGAKREDLHIYRHRRTPQPWRLCRLTTKGLSGMLEEILQKAKEGQKLWLCNTSKEMGEYQEELLRAELGEDARIIRIDSETNQNGEFDAFFRNPYEAIASLQPDVLITSPSVRSGSSYKPPEGQKGYFDHIYASSTCHDTAAHLQPLGRDRTDTPRTVFVPKAINTFGLEGSLSKNKILEVQAQIEGNVARMAGLDTQALQALQESKGTWNLQVTQAFAEYFAAQKRLSNAQKAIASESLAIALEAEGQTPEIDDFEANKPAALAWEEAKERVWRRRAEQFAAIQLDSEIHTPAWAWQRLRTNSSAEVRAIALKAVQALKFPGLDLNDAEAAYTLFFEKRGRVARRAKARAYTECAEILRARDQAFNIALLKAPVRLGHRYRTDGAYYAILAQTGILEFAATETTYSKETPRAIAIHEFCCKYADAVRDFLGLNIKADDTPVTTVNKLLKRIGPAPKRVKYAGSDGDRAYIYEVQLPEGLEAAAYLAAKAGVKAACDWELQALQEQPESPEQPEAQSEEAIASTAPVEPADEPANLPEPLEAQPPAPPTPHYCPAKGDLVSISGGHPEGYYIADLDLSHAYLLSADGESMVYAPITGLKPLEVIAS